MHESEKWKGSRSVVSDSSRPHGLQPTRLLRPWDFPSKSTGVGCHRLLRVVKKPPAKQETQIWSLSREEPPGRGHGNLLQCSWLENSMDRGAWWATVHRVAKSRIPIWVKWLTTIAIALQCLFASATHHQEKSATCIHAFPLSLEPPSHPRHPTPLGRHRALSWARCTAASPRYFTHGGVYMPMLLSQFVPPTSSPSPQALSLLLCLYSCPANSSSIPFF